MTKLSVVIPTYERPDDLERCLHSLNPKRQSIEEEFEVLVTDDSNGMESKSLVENRFPFASWDQGKKNGPAGNRNAGVARAKGEWIVFLDDDCFAIPEYLEAYSNAISQYPETQVFEGRSSDRPRITWAEGCPSNEKGGMLWTSNLCIRKDLFTEMNGLDERFRVAFEDVDLAYRLKQRGMESRFIAEVVFVTRGEPFERVERTGKKRDMNGNHSCFFCKSIRTLRRNTETQGPICGTHSEW